MTLHRLLSSAVLFATLAVSGSAQMVTSARSGTLHTFDGNVQIDGKSVEKRTGYFPEVKEKSVLSTQRGRAEVLLTPGVILRIGENSSIRMIDSRLASTRVEIVTGSAVLEQLSPDASPVKGSTNTVTIVYKDYEVSLRKTGLVEFFAEPGCMKVYKGEADVITAGTLAAGSRVVVKDGHMLTFNSVLAMEKFNDKTGDDLLLWARDRSQAISAANMSSARNYGSNAFGYGNYGNGWFFNPYFGMYTFLPMYGTYYSPWGWGYYSPYSIYGVYDNSGYYWNGGGAATGFTGAHIGQHLPTAASTIAGSLNRLRQSGGGGSLRPLAPAPAAASERANTWNPFGSQNNTSSFSSPSNSSAGFSSPSVGSVGSAHAASIGGGISSGSAAHGTAAGRAK